VYFAKKNFEVLKYKLLKRPLAIVPTASVLYICQDYVEKTNLHDGIISLSGDVWGKQTYFLIHTVY
jgi:hypothetical protein